jgi:hypothetical protein
MRVSSPPGRDRRCYPPPAGRFDATPGDRFAKHHTIRTSIPHDRQFENPDVVRIAVSATRLDGSEGSSFDVRIKGGY